MCSSDLLFIPGGPEYVPETDGYFVTFSCSGELNFASRGPELSLSGGHEYVPEADGYFVTLFCSGGA